MNKQQMPNHVLANLKSILAISLQNISQQVKKYSNQLSIKNNKLFEQLQSITQENVSSFINMLFSQLSQIAQIKQMSTTILNLINKLINFLNSQQNRIGLNLSLIFCSIINIITIIINIHPKISDSKNNNKNQFYLRIIQTIFSLINRQFLPHMEYNIIIRIYSLCFECCVDQMIQNIAITSLYCLTETICTSDRQQDALTLLTYFLEYLMQNKKFHWIKNTSLKSLVWDLVVICVKFFHQKIVNQPKDSYIVKLLITMYEISVQHVFSATHNNILKMNDKNTKKQHSQTTISDYIRFYRTFIFFSLYLSIQPKYNNQAAIVPFDEYLPSLKQACKIQLNIQTYIFLEGISLILVNWQNFMESYQDSCILIEIIEEVSEDLTLCEQVVYASEDSGYYLQKIHADITSVSNIEFINLIRNTIISLRKICQEYQSSHEHKMEMEKKWSKLIEKIIRIIKNISSINYGTQHIEQNYSQSLQILLEMQHWFIISPNFIIRNYILREILSIIQITNQAYIMKVSQCLQIVSNIMYGFYESMDSKGLEIVLEIQSRIYCSLKSSKGYEQLQQVVGMTDRLFNQQQFIQKQSTYISTICAFTHFIQTLLIHNNKPQTNLFPFDAPPMLSYCLSKLQIIILKKHNHQYLSLCWGSLTSIYSEIASSNNQQIRSIGYNSLSILISKIIEGNIYEQSGLKQNKIIQIYSILSRFNYSPQLLIENLKKIIPMLKTQESIVEIFKTLKNFQKNNKNQQIAIEFQQYLMKEYLYKITLLEYLNEIISNIGLTQLKQNNNLQYKLLTLLWCVADHLSKFDKLHQSLSTIWLELFNKFKQISLNTTNYELKQSILHSLTQLIGENLHLLQSNQLVEVWSNIYLPIVYDLLQLDYHQIQSTHDQNQQRLEMTKIAIKNYLKLIRKLQSEKIINGNQSIIQALYCKFTKFLQICCLKFKEVNVKPTIYIITDEYLYEICVLVEQSFIEPIQIPLQVLSQLTKQIQSSISNITQTTLCYQKRLKPHFNNIVKKLEQLSNHNT